MKKKNKKVKKVNKNKGRNIALVLLIIFLIILGLLSFVFFSNLDDNGTITDDGDMVTNLTLMGEQLYSEYYYKEESKGRTEEEMIEHLKKYETIGLKIDLNQLSKYNDDYKKAVDKFVRKNKKCKKSETMVIIYPQSPYTNKDFTSEFSKVCNIEDKK